jgi:hypothetical protein
VLADARISSEGFPSFSKGNEIRNNIFTHELNIIVLHFKSLKKSNQVVRVWPGISPH